MSGKADNHNNIRQLIEALGERTITQADGVGLELLLRNDAAVRRLYRDYFELQGMLIWSLRGGKTIAPSHAGSEQIKRTTSPLVFGILSGLVRTITHSPLAATMFVATLIYGVFGFLAWDLHPDKILNGKQGNDSSVAMPGAAVDVKWSPDATPKFKDSSIRVGESLKISSGTIELELTAGTKLLVEGPAEWSIDGENNATLTSGRLVARVPQSAIGFTVSTPTAEVIDLGTEFGVEVGESQATEVTVFKGSVRLEPPPIAGAKSKQPKSVTLSAGESRRIGREAAHGDWIVERPATTTSFVRQLKQESQVNGSLLPPHLMRIEDSGPQAMKRLEDSHFKAAHDDLLQSSLDPNEPVRPAADTPGLFPGERLGCLFNGRIYAPARTDLFVFPAAASIHEDSFTPVDRSSVDFYFDTSKAPQGYDIHRIETISSWLGTRSGQHYLVFVRFRGSSTFEQRRLLDINAPPVYGSYDYFERRIRASGTQDKPLATHVDAIRFVFLNFELSDPESKYREIDVVGNPTTIESSR